MNKQGISSLVVFGLLLVGMGSVRPSAGAAVTASRGNISLPTYPWQGSKHPLFRGTDQVNIYPYAMLDSLSREKTMRSYRTVVLENECLRITFLPELGGKIYEVIDKSTGQPMFYVNHVVKPGLIGQCGAWTSGGVEWNTGPQGHTVSCMTPVPVEILAPEKDGSRTVAIGETERIYGTKWTVLVTLRPGRSFIEERIRIYNPTETIRPYYFWNCTAEPNTPGFRFIYPMTLGCDHAGEKFFAWPTDKGKDLTRGSNYQDASSIFAWHCDQDFFGSYCDDLGRGVVSCANHHQVPGKKAWTWGHGGFGTMHQMDLTDDDGPYNEVQTGPLLTQAQVGRLDPCEAVEWQEWWYPVHGIGGFTFANRNLAANASREGALLKLRLLGTATWNATEVRVSGGAAGGSLLTRNCRLSPKQTTELDFTLPSELAQLQRVTVEVCSGKESLALFATPLDLPNRVPPGKREAPQTATELVEAGWQHLLFARFTEAETTFRKALEKDPESASAKTGLSLLRLDADSRAAAAEARAALEIEPGSGLAQYALAVAEDRNGNHEAALAAAWLASLEPVTAVAGRALVAKMETRAGRYRQAIDALIQPGPWQADPLCRNRLAMACLQLGEKTQAIQLARMNLTIDPLDRFAQSILWLARAEKGERTLAQELNGDANALLDLLAEYDGILPDAAAPTRRLLEEFGLRQAGGIDPIAGYWAKHVGALSAGADLDERLRQAPAVGVAPYHRETVPVLAAACRQNPRDGKAALLLGHVLFHLGRYTEARAAWQSAAESGAEPAVAYRALGMAAKTLDHDAKRAREWLEKAGQADPQDPIIARDLARVLFEFADKESSDSGKRDLNGQARDRLQSAFANGRGRSDFVALLARAHNQLEEYAETARMLDGVRVTVWEGAHEVHDLFEQAHLALAQAHLKAGHPGDAVAELNRALEFPANLATGKLETTSQAHLHLLRGNAFAALDKKSEAIAAWKRALAEPDSSEPRNIEARKEAKAALEKARQ